MKSSRDLGITLPSEVDVVVIGGGVLGCAILYHLSKLGIRKPLLLEKYQLTAGAYTCLYSSKIVN